VWTPQFESTLADDYRLVAMDCRGHGASGTPADRDAYRDSILWAADVRAVVEALDAPTLVGWSDGGLVVSDYLATYGDDAVGHSPFLEAADRFEADLRAFVE
jgi:pimeloyl-ACP methyl ester carboxylesterase